MQSKQHELALGLGPMRFVNSLSLIIGMYMELGCRKVTVISCNKENLVAEDFFCFFVSLMHMFLLHSFHSYFPYLLGYVTNKKCQKYTHFNEIIFSSSALPIWWKWIPRAFYTIIKCLLKLNRRVLKISLLAFLITKRISRSCSLGTTVYLTK